MDLRDLRRRAAEAKSAHKRLKALVRARETEVYGALGRLAVLPTEIVFAILDALFVAEVREYFQLAQRGHRGRPPVSAFRLFMACRDTLALREEWCAHAYRRLGGAEDGVDGWAWMRFNLLRLMSLITKFPAGRGSSSGGKPINASNVLTLGIIPERGWLVDILGPANFCKPRKLRKLSHWWRPGLLSTLPNTATYLLTIPETRAHFVGMFASTGVHSHIDRGVWLDALRSVRAQEVVTALSTSDRSDTLVELCDTPDRWAPFFVHNLLHDHWSMCPANLVALLRVYQATWFQCWADMGCTTKMKCADHRVAIMMQHAPQELLDMPQRASGNSGPGRSSFVFHNLVAMMQSPHWQRARLSGVYYPLVRSEVVYARIQQCGGRIHPTALVLGDGAVKDLEALLPRVERAPLSARAHKHLMGMARAHARVVQAVLAHCYERGVPPVHDE
jgi:hypothetical protein